MKGSFNKLFRNIASHCGSNEFERRLIKATYGDDSKAPKEKHMIYLMTVMHGSCINVSSEQMLATINERCEEFSDNWAVNIKSQIVLHRILQDKMLSKKIIDLRDKFNFPVYEIKNDTKLTKTQIEMASISRNYQDYLKTLLNFLKTSDFKSLTKDSGSVKAILEEMESKEIVIVMSRLKTLIDMLAPQLNNHDSCAKNRLGSSYLSNLFLDYCKLYTMFFSGMEITKKRFDSLKPKAKKKSVKHYEFLLEFTKDISLKIQSLPYLLGMKITTPKLYKANPETLVKLQTKAQAKVYSYSTKQVLLAPLNSNDNSSNDNQSEAQVERFFSERANSLNSSNFQSISQQSSKRLEVAQEASMIDNFLGGARRELRTNTMKSVNKSSSIAYNSEIESNNFSGVYQTRGRNATQVQHMAGAY